jgi:hypothetical protein
LWVLCGSSSHPVLYRRLTKEKPRLYDSKLRVLKPLENWIPCHRSGFLLVEHHRMILQAAILHETRRDVAAEAILIHRTRLAQAEEATLDLGTHGLSEFLI